MEESVRRLALIGAESTGKSTLAAALAERIGTVFVPEFLRLWVDRQGRVPKLADMPEILAGQKALEEEALRRAKGWVILDTSPLVLAVLSRHYLGAVPEVIERAIVEDRPDLLILTAPDIPWVPDGIQRESAQARDAIHREIVDELERRGLSYVQVSGSVEERVRKVLEAVSLHEAQ